MKFRFPRIVSLSVAALAGALLASKGTKAGARAGSEGTPDPGTLGGVGGAPASERRAGLSDSDAYLAGWSYVENAELDSLVRSDLRRALLLEWCLIDLQRALPHALEVGMADDCAEGIGKEPEKVWQWIHEGKFGLGTQSLLNLWTGIVSEQDPVGLLERFEDLPADLVKVDRSRPSLLLVEDFVNLEQAPLRTIGGDHEPYEFAPTVRERALLGTLSKARDPGTDPALRERIGRKVLAIVSGEGGRSYREIVRLHHSALPDQELADAILKSQGDLPKQLHLEALADKLGRLEEEDRVKRLAALPDELRDVVERAIEDGGGP